MVAVCYSIRYRSSNPGAGTPLRGASYYFEWSGGVARSDPDLTEMATRACIAREELILHHRKNPQNGEKAKTKRYRVKPYFLYVAGEVWNLYGWAANSAINSAWQN
jgi:hypothetical protein